MCSPSQGYYGNNDNWLQDANDFSETHLKEIAKDIIQWIQSGKVPEGKFKELVDMIPDNVDDKLSVAKGIAVGTALVNIIEKI